jgi:hypothetical protein
MSLFPLVGLPIGVNVQPTTTPFATPTTAAQIASAVTAAAAVAEAGDLAELDANAPILPTTTTTLLNTAAIQAAATQGSLAPLLADLTTALQSTALPAAARTTLEQILSAQTPLTTDTTAASLQTAVASSGLFLEANLATAATAAATATTTAQTPAIDTTTDMKALLLQLSSTLDPATLDPAAVDPLTAALVNSTLQTRPQAQARQTLPPRPVIAGAVTAGTPVAKVSLGPDTNAQVLTSSLRQEAASALARLTMSQLASVPKPGETTRWSFELPVETPAGLSIAQFEISRDDHKASGADQAEPTWRARFSVDVEPSGPVHAEVSLSAGRTRATLWAERDGVHQSLDAQSHELTAALAETEGADAAVRVVAGAPPDTSPQISGRFVDRTS